MAAAEVQEFFDRLRSGDQDEVERLLRRLEPSLRRVIRMRLVDDRLRRVVDTSDVFQSLMKDFLSQQRRDGSPREISAGLYAYLAAAVHHKVRTRERKERRKVPLSAESLDVAATQPAVDRQIENREFVETVRNKLDDDLRRLFDLNSEGFTWKEIAERVGGNPDALRMKLRRQLANILIELEPEEPGRAP
jgi:DNA-directed RNA polymerase specialized sigma24 family protein